MKRRTRKVATGKHIALFALLLSCRGWTVEPLKQMTKSASQAMDVEKEVKAFVEDQIRNDPQIKARYESLVAPVKEEAGTRFNPGDWWALLWKVPHKSWDVHGHPRTEDSESIYLVGQPLWSGAVDSRWMNQTVVVQVRLQDHQTSSADHSKVLTDKITLTFEGFVDLKPQIK